LLRGTSTELITDIKNAQKQLKEKYHKRLKL
jgi:hypothetical protein